MKQWRPIFGWHRNWHHEYFLDLITKTYGFYLFGLMVCSKMYIIHDDDYALCEVHILGFHVWTSEEFK